VILQKDYSVTIDYTDLIGMIEILSMNFRIPTVATPTPQRHNQKLLFCGNLITNRQPNCRNYNSSMQIVCLLVKWLIRGIFFATTKTISTLFISIEVIPLEIHCTSEWSWEDL
jgi:hypothetical protein